MNVQHINESFNFLVNSEEHSKGVSNRYGYHKHLVRRTQLREKLLNFLAPRPTEIPKQEKRDNAKLLENVPLQKTFVPFLNERTQVGSIMPQNRIEKEMKLKLFKVTPQKFEREKSQFNTINQQQRSRQSLYFRQKESNHDISADRVISKKKRSNKNKGVIGLKSSRSSRVSYTSDEEDESEINAYQDKGRKSKNEESQVVFNNPFEAIKVRQRSGSLLRNVSNPILQNSLKAMIQKRIDQSYNTIANGSQVNDSKVNESSMINEIAETNRSHQTNETNIETFRGGTNLLMALGGTKTIGQLPSIQVSKVLQQNFETIKEEQAKLIGKLTQNKKDRKDKDYQTIIESQPYDEDQYCKVNYNFTGAKSFRNYNKTHFSQRAHSVMDIKQNLQSSSRNASKNDHSQLYSVVPKHKLLKENASPAPNKYSLTALSQKKALEYQKGRAYGFPKGKINRCEFFYPYNPKEFSQNYHNQLEVSQFSCMTETPTFTFGKNQSRDAASDIKSVVAIINEMKALKEQKKKERMHVHTLREFEEEEFLKRNMGTMLPNEYASVSANKSYNQNSIDIQIRSNSDVIIPQITSQGKLLKKELKNQIIKDQEFQLRGVLKQSLATVIQKYPAFCNNKWQK